VRILVVTSSSASHLIPMVPFAWALRVTGHEVRVACDASVAPAVVGHGLTASVVAGDARFAERHRDAVVGGPGRRTYRGRDALPVLFADDAAQVMAELMTVGERWRPDAIVHDPVAFAGEVLAAALGVPAIRHLWGPDILGTAAGRWLLTRVYEHLDDVITRYAGPDATLRQAIIDPCPPSLQSGTANTAIRYVPVDRPGVVPDWLLGRAGADRICVTWGTFGDGVPDGHPLRGILDELSGCGREVVLAILAADLDRIGALPAGVRPVTDVPLHAILPACSAIVHHGGANTMLSAVTRGLPQLVVSDTYEQAFNADRLASTGAGLHVGAAAADSSAIRSAVARLADDASLAVAAAELGAAMHDRPSPGAVAAGIADLLAQSPRRALNEVV
jgi:UDP:flavonoid glycosyltransferase YjiC (YdhE family)